MPRIAKLSHEFVDHAPDILEEGVLYISLKYGTVLHRCCCGCGTEVVTPLTPTDWKIIYDGKTVSLQPSIGNWQQPCRSHYWVRENRVVWARSMTEKQIDAGRRVDAARKQDYYGSCASDASPMLRGASVDDAVGTALRTTLSAKGSGK